MKSMRRKREAALASILFWYTSRNHKKEIHVKDQVIQPMDIHQDFTDTATISSWQNMVLQHPVSPVFFGMTSHQRVLLKHQVADLPDRASYFLLFGPFFILIVVTLTLLQHGLIDSHLTSPSLTSCPPEAMKDLFACQLPLMRTNLFILDKIKEKPLGIFRLAPQGDELAGVGSKSHLFNLFDIRFFPNIHVFLL